MIAAVKVVASCLVAIHAYGWFIRMPKAREMLGKTSRSGDIALLIVLLGMLFGAATIFWAIWS